MFVRIDIVNIIKAYSSKKIKINPIGVTGLSSLDTSAVIGESLEGGQPIHENRLNPL